MPDRISPPPSLPAATRLGILITLAVTVAALIVMFGMRRLWAAP